MLNASGSRCSPRCGAAAVRRRCGGGAAAARSPRVFNSECRRAEYSRTAINIHEYTVAVASLLQNIFQYTARAGRGGVKFARYYKSMATARERSYPYHYSESTGGGRPAIASPARTAPAPLSTPALVRMAALTRRDARRAPHVTTVRLVVIMLLDVSQNTLNTPLNKEKSALSRVQRARRVVDVGRAAAGAGRGRGGGAGRGRGGGAGSGLGRSASATLRAAADLNVDAIKEKLLDHRIPESCV
ncbi:hypothetical protein MSG28_002577 [Choristoneura fumiferana]|uniref:Uncharacterized protein n=1 Tax=Choristoneura fumiferana TaxID=7141 RepID=A0ACC0JWU5_CHOFU|nr:hypothetical protein MSG28_002577 [Choristoneura fumiferana]